MNKMRQFCDPVETNYQNREVVNIKKIKLPFFTSLQPCTHKICGIIDGVTWKDLPVFANVTESLCMICSKHHVRTANKQWCLTSVMVT